MGSGAADVLEAMIGGAHKLVFEAEIDAGTDLIKDSRETLVTKGEIAGIVDRPQHVQIVKFGVNSAGACAQIGTETGTERDLVFKGGQDRHLEERKGVELFFRADRPRPVGHQTGLDAGGQGVAESVATAQIEPNAGVKLQLASAERIARETKVLDPGRPGIGVEIKSSRWTLLDFG